MYYQHWFLFIVRCSDGSLYSGTAADAEQAVGELNQGKGSTYTRSRLPVSLAYTEEYMNEGDAQKRLAEMKKFSRADKDRLIARADEEKSRAAAGGRRGFLQWFSF